MCYVLFMQNYIYANFYLQWNMQKFVKLKYVCIYALYEMYYLLFSIIFNQPAINICVLLTNREIFSVFSIVVRLEKKIFFFIHETSRIEMQLFQNN